MGLNLADLFETVADAAPHAPAIVAAERRLTFAELEARSNQLAHALTARGVGPGDRVALLLPNGSEYLEGMLAAFKVRAIPVNVNYRYVDDELAALLADADPRVIISSPPHMDRAPLRTLLAAGVATLVAPECGRKDELDRAAVGGAPNRVTYDDAIADEAATRDFGPRSGDDHYVLYTGGTTGRPKGVVWRHEDFFYAALGGRDLYDPPLRDARDLADHLRPGRVRTLPASPFIHGTAHWIAITTFFAAGAVIIAPQPRFDPVATWELIDAEQVTNLAIVGDAFARPLLDAFNAARDAGHTPGASLHALISGGARLSPALKEQLAARLPGMLLIDGFGASESGGHGRHVTAGGAVAKGMNAFAFDHQTFVADAAGRTVAPGEIGRLARRGRIPLGYFNDPFATAETFPIVDGHRIARLSDIARLELDGTITVIGRDARTINTGGEKVHAEEVEAALLSFPDIDDAVVLGTPDARWGERVVALIVAKTPATAPAEIAERLRGRIAGYKIPTRCYAIDAVPRTETGKVDVAAAKACIPAESTTKDSGPDL
jgi:acyl-CoA synthetase (AMP-forming)/AMP-acid ligase II